LKVGNTQVLAEMIAARLACDVHRIEAAGPYSNDYDDTVARNVRVHGPGGRRDRQYRPPRGRRKRKHLAICRAF
jgi:hypothetical protein